LIDFRLSRRVDSLITCAIRLRRKSKFASRSNMFRSFKVSTSNNSLAENQKLCFYDAHPASPEGRYGQSSRNVKQVAVDAGGSARRAMTPADGQIVWVRLDGAYYQWR
jgi:hypothetical protein